MTTVGFPDPKWLDFFKAGGLAFAAIAMASGAFLLLERWGYVPLVADWAQATTVGFFLLTACLTFMNFLVLFGISSSRKRYSSDW